MQLIYACGCAIYKLQRNRCIRGQSVPSLALWRQVVFARPTHEIRFESCYDIAFALKLRRSCLISDFARLVTVARVKVVLRPRGRAASGGGYRVNGRSRIRLRRYAIRAIFSRAFRSRGRVIFTIGNSDSAVMKCAPSGPSKGQGPKSLPLQELKSLFLSFLVQQGIRCLSGSRCYIRRKRVHTNTRESSPGPSVCNSKRVSNAFSSDDAYDQSDGTVKGSDGKVEDSNFIQVRRKPQKLARRQKMNKTNSTDSINMDLDTNTGVSTVVSDTSASTHSTVRVVTTAATTIKA
ncbi:hypothetical protein EVAR_95509_1 [Eumeta japonica]|uniref:Uncharacterized protein n=1 Tax=Eumeta variegata TaxID=151549 RepID=A0A4C1UIT9_EUMVA|nr:hypothetical protein EVAR_95509_1 [Eumeta japonica]